MRLNKLLILLFLLVSQVLSGQSPLKDEIVSTLSLKDDEFVLTFFGTDVNVPAVMITKFSSDDRKNSEYFVVFRGAYAGPFSSLTDISGRVIISRETGTMAYVKTITGRYYVVVGSQQEGPYWLMEGDLHLSPDGRSFLYAAHEDQQWFLFCNNTKTGLYDRISDLVVSSDNKSHAFIGELQGKKYVVGQGYRFGPFNDIACSPVFSPDGTTIAFAVYENFKGVIYLGTPQMDFRKVLDTGADFISSKSLVIASDNKTVGYIAAYSNNFIYLNNMYLMKNDERMGPFMNLIGKPWISADGRYISCVVEGTDEQIRVIGTQCVYGSYQKAEILNLSQDGKSIVYMVMPKEINNQWWCFLDGEIIGKITGSPDVVPNIIFSPIRKNIAYATKINDKWYARVNDVTTGPYDRVGPMAFSSDEKTFTFLVLSGKNIIRKVIAVK